jgi:regulatory protein
MKITAIKRRKRTPNRLNVYLDGKYAFGVAEEVATARRLKCGLHLTAEQLQELTGADLVWRTRETAIRLLARRARSTNDLRARLRRQHFPPQAIENTVAELSHSGLLDDADFARAFLQARLRGSPKGRSALYAELRARGVDADTAETALRAIYDEEPARNLDLDLARRAAARFVRKPNEEPRRARQRLHNFLARRRFTPESIHRVIDELDS